MKLPCPTHKLDKDFHKVPPQDNCTCGKEYDPKDLVWVMSPTKPTIIREDSKYKFGFTGFKLA